MNLIYNGLPLVGLSNSVAQTWFTGTTVNNSTGKLINFPYTYTKAVRLATSYVVPSSVAASMGAYVHSVTLSSAYFICRDGAAWQSRPFHCTTIGY